jgi:hypothetical protein
MPNEKGVTDESVRIRHEDGNRRSQFLSEPRRKSPTAELRDILLQLADDEQKHYRLFKAMHEGAKTQYQESEQTTILKTVKNVFEKMKAQNKQFNFAAEAKQIWEEAARSRGNPRPSTVSRPNRCPMPI